MCRNWVRHSNFIIAALLAAVNSGAWWNSATALTRAVESKAIASGQVRATPAAQYVKSYMIFFNHKQGELPEHGGPVLDRIIAEMKPTRATKFEVIGHTDKTLPEAESKVLSRERADAIKAGLIARGVPAAAIKSTGMGKLKPMVQTPEGEPHPGNRRVEVLAYK